MKRKVSKAIAVILCMLLVMTTAPVAFASDGPLTGTGTATNPYKVSDAAGLAALADDPAAYKGKTVVLTADIELDPDSFTPIGSRETPFEGIFDGGGFKIEGGSVWIGGDDSDFGVFGYVKNATLKNVDITGLWLTGDTNVGLLAGYAENTEISGVKADEDSKVEGYANIGGIVGALEGRSVTDCSSAAEAALYDDGENDLGNIGGIAGYVVGDVLRCINSGTVESQHKNSGGIVGSCEGTVSHCINKGAVTSYSFCAAGIAGFLKGEVSYCGNAADVFSENDGAGIFCGGEEADVSFCYNAGRIEADVAAKIAFEKSGVTVADCADDSVDLKQAASYPDTWDFENVWYPPQKNKTGGDAHGYAYPTLRDCHFHSFIETVTDATCLMSGSIDRSCDCGLEENETIPATGHRWGAWVVETAATCKMPGERKHTCDACGTEETEEIAIDPNAHEDSDGDNLCDRCGATIEEEQPDSTAKQSLFGRILSFFRRVLDWIRKLFKRR